MEKQATVQRAEEQFPLKRRGSLYIRPVFFSPEALRLPFAPVLFLGAGGVSNAFKSPPPVLTYSLP